MGVRFISSLYCSSDTLGLSCVSIGHAPVDYGAYYMVNELKGKPFQHRLWLCPVTEFVFGGYPNQIYIEIIDFHRHT
jgi:hypothetical protein